MSTRDTNDEEIILLSYDEAVAMLPDGEQVHTILDAGVALLGADMDRGALLQLLKDSPAREVTGPAAQAMGHGLAAYQPDGTPVFIETRKQEPPEVTEAAEAAEAQITAERKHES